MGVKCLSIREVFGILRELLWRVVQVLPCTGLARQVYWRCDRGSEKLKMLCGVSGVSSHGLAQNMFGEPLCQVITRNNLLVIQESF